MEPIPLLLHVSWTWGGAKDVVTDSHDVIGDCLEREGFVSPDGGRVFAAYRGQIINRELSFDYYHIPSGSCIFLTHKTLRRNRRSQPFLDFINRRHSQASLAKARDQARFEEIARITDLAFAVWDSSPEFRTLLRRISTDRLQQFFSEGNDQVTVVKPADKICCDPLPMLLGDHSDVSESEPQRSGFTIKQVIAEPVEKPSKV